MPKRLGNIYEQIISLDNLIAADELARKNKRYSSDMRRWDEQWDENITRLHYLLAEQAYAHGEYRHFTTRTEGKERYISVSKWQDRVVHKAFCIVVEPLLNAKLSKVTYANIKGKGQHVCARQVRGAISRMNNPYCLKMDIRKYYPSVCNEVMMKTIRKYIKDKRALWLADEIIKSTDCLPIGNITSQLFGNLVLDDLDKKLYSLAKDNVFRYCDDIVVISEDKAKLHHIRREVDDYLSDRSLTMKPNWQVFPVNDRGIDFCIGRIFKTHVRLRKRLKIAYTRRLREWEDFPGDPAYEERWWASISGVLAHTNSKHLIKKWKYEYPEFFERLRERKATRAVAIAQRKRVDLATKLQYKGDGTDIGEYSGSGAIGS